MSSSRVIFLIVALLFSVAAQAQYRLEGTVLNGSDKTPLEGASVFINNASKGSITDKNGRFTLENISFDNFELVVSYISFETIVVKINPTNIKSRFRIELAKKENELKEIVIGPRIKDGWKQYGKFFTELFVGTSANAMQCKLLNPDVLQFRFDKKTNVLSVSAIDQMQIENDALGLIITYQLESFSYDYGKRMLSYTGYSSYRKMQSSRKRKMEKWRDNRTEAYNGSLMHFMRALYANKITQEGFTMREMIRLYKKDSSTISLYNEAMTGKFNLIDTGKYAIQLVKPNTGFDRNPIAILYNKKFLPTDSVRWTVDDNIYLAFNNYLRVTYTKELEKPEYVMQQSGFGFSSKSGGKNQTSLIVLPNDNPVVVEKTGMYYDPLDLYTEEYWAWEKMAELLPADYVVGE